MKRVVTWIAVTDFVVLAAATLAAMLAKFGLETGQRTWGPFELTYPQFGLVVALVWWWALTLFEAREAKVLGEGLKEFRRIGRASAFAFGSIAVVSVIIKLDFSRGYIAVALPAGLLGLLVSRWCWRVWLRRQRGRGRYLTGVLVIGNSSSVERLADLFTNDRGSGYRVVGSWDPAQISYGRSDHGDDRMHDDLVEQIRQVGADAVVVADPQALGAEGMRSISWGFTDIEILVSPHFEGVALERVRLNYLSGEPVIRLDQPQFERAGGLAKLMFDWILAGLLTLLLAPLLVVVAIAVKTTSKGPVLFGHERVGKDGKRFTMWKFRSMREGAEHEFHELLSKSGGDHSPLFKIEDDPRITQLGRFLRRSSLDELPQLFNVLTGTMSLVGPRPQVPAEVAMYQGHESTRLHVRPGITGMWQVSGRSNLPWSEAVRLDLYYVENWSMLVDLVILWRTVGVVVRGDGAR